MPPQFNYLIDLVGKYGVDAVQVQRTGKDFVDRLADAQLDELARGYEEITRRGDGPSISLWLDQAHAQVDPDRRRIWLLMVLFQQLREKGKAPFSSFDVRLLPKSYPPCEWTKLPPQLRYLVDAAEEYGTIQFEEDVDKLVKGVTPLQLKELVPIAQQAHRDMPEIDRWLDDYNMTKHREAALVYFLLSLLTRLRLM